MRPLLLLAAAFLASPALAQQQTPAQPPAAPSAAQPDQDEEIVVIGERELERAVNEFVRTLDGPFYGGDDPLMRLEGGPICPIAVGLRPERNVAIADRMRRVARAAGMEAATSADCKTNVLVLFTRDKEAAVAALRRRYRNLFMAPDGQRVNVQSETGPAMAWHVDMMVDRDNNPVGYGATVSTAWGGSRLRAQVRRIILGAVVVIEMDALAGLTATQIADYAAMRAYTQVDAARVRTLTAPTILTALEAPMGSAQPVTLTSWDLSYLRALHDLPALQFGGSGRAAIRRQMFRDMNAPAREREREQDREREGN